MSKIKCNCPCHQPGSSMKHVKRCCVNGYVEFPVPTPSTLSPEIGEKRLRWVKASERLPDGPRNENSKVIVRPINNSKLATVTFAHSFHGDQWYDSRYYFYDTEWLEEIDAPTAHPTETPATWEAPADVIKWIQDKSKALISSEDYYNFPRMFAENCMVAMYHKMQEEMTRELNLLAADMVCGKDQERVYKRLQVLCGPSAAMYNEMQTDKENIRKYIESETQEGSYSGDAMRKLFKKIFNENY